MQCCKLTAYSFGNYHFTRWGYESLSKHASLERQNTLASADIVFIFSLRIFWKLNDILGHRGWQVSRYQIRESWAVCLLLLQLCSSAMSTWTDPVWKPPTHQLPASSCTQCSALELCWLYLEISWWWFPFSTSSSCILQAISWSPPWPVQTSWWEWLWCPSA